MSAKSIDVLKTIPLVEIEAGCRLMCTEAGHRRLELRKLAYNETEALLILLLRLFDTKASKTLLKLTKATYNLN